MIIWHANCSLVFLVTIRLIHIFEVMTTIAFEQNSDEINDIYLS